MGLLGKDACGVLLLAGLGDSAQFGAGIHGVLASFIEADSSCARAIEAALGSHVQAVLVENETLATAIVDRLTEQKLGKAAVIPETFIGAPSGTQMEAVPEGGIAWALDRVKSDRRVSAVMEKLLDNVMITADLNAAIKLRRSLPAATFVTLQGEIVKPEGTITGGAAGEGSNSVLERQNEVRDLTVEVDRLRAEDEAFQAKLVELGADVLLVDSLLPDYGGNTLFANMYLAYERMPEKLKSRVEDRKSTRLNSSH